MLAGGADCCVMGAAPQPLCAPSFGNSNPVPKDPGSSLCINTKRRFGLPNRKHSSGYQGEVKSCHSDCPWPSPPSLPIQQGNRCAGNTCESARAGM